MAKKKKEKESSVKDILKGKRTFRPGKPSPQIVIKLKPKENPGNPNRSDNFNKEMEKEKKDFLK